MQNIQSTNPWLTTRFLVYVTQVLTIKTDKQGNFVMAKARWVWRGFQDKQKEYQQTDSLLPQDPDFG